MDNNLHSSSLPLYLRDFWRDIALKTLDWLHPWNSVATGTLQEGEITWFDGAQLNVCANCIDRHLPDKAHHRAIIWESDSGEQTKTLNFSQLHEEVCRMSNVLKKLGVKKGMVVAIYLPMIVEAAIAMLACARIGAIHTVVFAGFSSQALRQRLIASQCHHLISVDSFTRGGKSLAVKERVDEATQDLDIQTLIIAHGGLSTPLNAQQYWWHELKNSASSICPSEPMNAEDPLFILYTSGSTGQPKGLVHTTAGYLVQAAYTHKLIFSCQEQDVFWSTADVGWITGHSYVVYGALANGITTVMHEGIPTWPNPDRHWQIIDKHQVSVLYTSPTAIRTLMKAGDHWLESSSRASLRLLGSVGEPINPEAWHWLGHKVGNDKCPIVDTWWQTETGAIMISPMAADGDIKPGSAQKPLPGIVPVLLDAQYKEITGSAEGLLAIKYPWPAMARTIAGDHARFCQTYLTQGYYLTGDGAKRDADGDYWITGRVDDVINVSGHRIGTAEIESALITHKAVAESGVVAITHEIKGQGIYAFIILKQAEQATAALQQELIQRVSQEIGAIAKPDFIQFVSDLPKTRSGKIMRRILRKIANKEVSSLEELGDLSTLANPEAVIALLPS